MDATFVSDATRAPRGFTVGDFALAVQSMKESTPLLYDARRAAYDLKKPRAKNLLTKVGRSRRYSVPSEAIRTIGALLILPEKVLRSILAGRQDMLTLFEDLRNAA